jgi:hypothetical protein
MKLTYMPVRQRAFLAQSSPLENHGEMNPGERNQAQDQKEKSYLMKKF